MDAPPREAARAAAAWARVAARTLALLPRVGPAHFLEGEGASQALMQRWSEACLDELGLELVVDDRTGGPLDDPPYLFVHLNQASLLETFIYPAVLPLPLRIVMNVEYVLGLPLLGLTLAATGSRTIVRQWRGQAKRQMARVADDMRRRKRSFGLSIEGRRSHDGSLQPYKGGPAHLAIAAQARVLPFFLHGAHRALPRGAWQVRPGRIHGVTFPPIDTRGWALDRRHELTAELRALAEAEHARGIVEGLA